jgi:hypothetical protein
MFVPVNAATTILVNAITGMLIWEDWKVVQSWAGYICVFLLMGLGCTLLLGDLSLLQETAPETFRGARYPMMLRSNRERLLENIRNIGNQVEGFSKKNDNEHPVDSSHRNRHDAWVTVYELGGAAPEHSISTRTIRHRRNEIEGINGIQKHLSKTWSGPSRTQLAAIAPAVGAMNLEELPISSSKLTPGSTSSVVPSSPIPMTPPEDFKYTKGTCALSWWRPIKLLEEGSISDIHLVKPRKEFVEVKYKEKRNVMDLAKRKTFFSRGQSNGEENDADVKVLKSIIKSHIGDDSVLEEMRREILVMSHLKHPNICKLYEAYERIHHVYLIMEYCP